MDRNSAFSYLCQCCGRCCHDQVITLSPYDVIRIGRAAGIPTSEAVAKYTMRRGSLLRFDQNGACVALQGTTCTIHPGRPLACRLYPLGMERERDGSETYLRLQPAAGSLGIYGDDRSVDDFLAGQGTEHYLSAVRGYSALLGVCRERIGQLMDFELVEPREFWRIAVREALAESGFDGNHLIGALFDPDALRRVASSDGETVEQHVRELKKLIRAEKEANIVATAAVLLAVSLGYTPGEIILGAASPRVVPRK
jgi:hypothetical protein